MLSEQNQKIVSEYIQRKKEQGLPWDTLEYSYLLKELYDNEAEDGTLLQD